MGPSTPGQYLRVSDNLYWPDTDGDTSGASELPLLLWAEEYKFYNGVEGGRSAPNGPDNINLGEVHPPCPHRIRSSQERLADGFDDSQREESVQPPIRLQAEQWG